MIDLLLTLVLALHLVCMNVASAAPLVCIALDGRKLDRESPRYQAGRTMAKLTLLGLLLGVLLGMAAGGLLWLGGHRRFFAALGLLTSRVQFGMAEMVFSWACYIGYMVWWQVAPRKRAWQQMLHGALAVLGATNLIYHFPSFFAVTSGLATGTAVVATAGEPLTHAQYLEQMWAPDVLSRWLHFTLASAAAGGVLLMCVAVRMLREEGISREAVARLVAWGARLALGVTVVQMFVGPWVLLTMPSAMQQRLMGGSLLATGSLLAGIVLSVGLMHHLAGLAWGDVQRKAVVRSTSIFLLTVIVMTGALHYARGDALRQPATPETEATPQSQSADNETPQAEEGPTAATGDDTQKGDNP